MLYAGNEGPGLQFLKKALELEPDNGALLKMVRNVKKSNDMKEEAGKLFKANDIEGAVKKFQDCLNIDPLNVTYNATIYLNLAIALSKQKKNEEALAALNKCLTMSPDYVKAYVKRAEVNQLLKNWQESVHDYSRAKELDTQNQYGTA